MAGLTLDTGALFALERHRKGMTKVIEAARQGRVSITVPSNAIAEWWRGRTDRRDYVRKMFVIKDVDEQIAKLAGEALASLKPQGAEVDGKVTIDATVMATSAIHGPNLYTGDFDDMQRFQRFFPSVRLFGLNLPR
jgi:predicted nucleic acid-binding protein